MTCAARQALQEEISERGVELESVRWETADLTGQDREKLAAILEDLSQRWKAAQDRCKQYQKVMEAKDIDSKVGPQGGTARFACGDFRCQCCVFIIIRTCIQLCMYLPGMFCAPSK